MTRFAAWLLAALAPLAFAQAPSPSSNPQAPAAAPKVAAPLGASLAAPDTWRKETFEFPLAFAPSIPFEGTEHVRFAPYWAEFASDRGFTYAILWDIKRRDLEPAEIERALHVYFDGLMESVTKARKIDDPGTVSSASLHPLKAPEGWDHALGGRLWTWNGFNKGEPLTLHVEIAYRACGAERTHILLAFSKAPRISEPWPQLASIRNATVCPPASPRPERP